MRMVLKGFSKVSRAAGNALMSAVLTAKALEVV